MKESGDKEIRELFERLRVGDREDTPSFRQTLKGRPRGSGSHLPGLRLAKLAVATALLALISAVLFVQRGDPSGPPSIQAAAAMSGWVSPTESLLRPSSEELLAGQIGWSALPDLTLEFEPATARSPLPKEKKR